MIQFCKSLSFVCIVCMVACPGCQLGKRLRKKTVSSDESYLSQSGLGESGPDVTNPYFTAGGPEPATAQPLYGPGADIPALPEVPATAQFAPGPPTQVDARDGFAMPAHVPITPRAQSTFQNSGARPTSYYGASGSAAKNFAPVPEEIENPYATGLAQTTAVSLAAPNGPTTNTSSQRADSGIALRIHGVKAQQGPVRVAVFDSSAQFPKHENAALKMVMQSASATVMQVVPMGATTEIAMAAYQDINNDGKLNRNSFGMPTEPYGFSGNAAGKFGPPSFESASLRPNQSSGGIDIMLK